MRPHHAQAPHVVLLGEHPLAHPRLVDLLHGHAEGRAGQGQRRGHDRQGPPRPGGGPCDRSSRPRDQHHRGHRHQGQHPAVRGPQQRAHRGLGVHQVVHGEHRGERDDAAEEVQIGQIGERHQDEQQQRREPDPALTTRAQGQQHQGQQRGGSQHGQLGALPRLGPAQIDEAVHQHRGGHPDPQGRPHAPQQPAPPRRRPRSTQHEQGEEPGRAQQHHPVARQPLHPHRQPGLAAGGRAEPAHVLAHHLELEHEATGLVGASHSSDEGDRLARLHHPGQRRAQALAQHQLARRVAPAVREPIAALGRPGLGPGVAQHHPQRAAASRPASPGTSTDSSAQASRGGVTSTSSRAPGWAAAPYQRTPSRTGSHARR